MSPTIEDLRSIEDRIRETPDPPKPLEYNSPDVLFRHTGWATQRNDVHAALVRTGQSLTRRTEFSSCGRGAWVYVNPENRNEVRVAGSCCHDRFCLPCAQQRGRAIASALIDVLHGQPCRFLTLTVKTDGLPLRAAIEKLYKAFAKLRRHDYWKSRVEGGAAFLEVKWNEDAQRWHPHLHCLLVGKYVDQKLLKAAWWKVTGDSYIVDIRFVERETHVLRYVTKYVSKPYDNSYVRRPQRLDEVIVAVRKLRMVITFGSWRGTPLTPQPIETAWEKVCSLDDLMRAGARSEAWALAVLAKLEADRVDVVLAQTPPGPPPPEPEPPPFTGGQLPLPKTPPAPIR